ncbi:MAG: glycosyltransferase family 4 protein [Pelagibacterales bacterium]|nr:glycosyltransferase family 4 protein [Pelagibacterales bacterium]
MVSKFKVLQVIPKLGYGGAETGCYDLAHYLHEMKCKSYIITSGGELIKYIDKKKVTVIKLPVQSKNPLLILINSIIITFIIFFLNISIVHARSRAPAWSCYIATRITRRKFVTTFHGAYNFNNSIKKFYNSVMIKSDLLIAGSNFIFSHIQENYEKYLNRKKKFLVIFRGINTEYFDPETLKQADVIKLKNSWKLDDGKKIILLPGRLTYWKGQEIFIESLSKFRSTNPQIEFIGIILGNDQGRKVYGKKLERLVQQHRLSDVIKFVENCKIMPLAYELADIVISSSVEPEAFGRVAVEAQSMKKPIIASNIGGSNETIVNNKTGFLFESGSADSLSDMLTEVINLDTSTLNSIGNEGRKNVLKKFNIEKMCFNTYSEYKKLLN